MELKDILDYLDLGEVTDIDGLKAKFSEKFVPKSSIPDEEKIKSKTTGAIIGSLNQAFKKKFGFTNEEIENKKWEDLFEAGISKKEKEIEELKLAASQTNDTVIKELNEKLSKANESVKNYKEQFEGQGKQFEDFKKIASEERKKDKLSYIFTDAKSKVLPKLVKMDELTRAGFEAYIRENLFLDLDESGEIIVNDKEGKRFANPNKAGSFMRPEEALEFISSKLGVLEKNNGSGTQTFTPQKRENTSQGKEEVKLSPVAIKYAEAVKKG